MECECDGYVGSHTCMQVKSTEEKTEKEKGKRKESRVKKIEVRAVVSCW